MLNWEPKSEEELKNLSEEELREVLKTSRREFEQYKQAVRASMKKSRASKSLDELCHVIVNDGEDKEKDLNKLVTLLINDKHKTAIVTPEVIDKISDADLIIKLGDNLKEAGEEKRRQEIISAQKKKKKAALKPLMREGVKGNLRVDLKDYNEDY